MATTKETGYGSTYLKPPINHWEYSATAIWGLWACVLVTFSGYCAKNLASRYSLNDVEKLTKVGAGVAFALLYSCIAWFELARQILEGHPWQIPLAVGWGLLGSTLVLFTDRGLLYAADACTLGIVQSFFVFLIRIAFALCVGSLLAQSLVPKIFKTDLTASSITFVSEKAPYEASEQEKADLSRLDEHIAVKKQAVAAEKEKLGSLEQEAATLQKKLEAQQNDYVMSRKRYRDQHGPNAYLPRSIKNKRAMFLKTEKTMQENEQAIAAFKSTIAIMEQTLLDSLKQRDNAGVSIRERINNTRTNLEQAFTYRTSEVLEHALRNPVFFLKWVTISVLLAACELLPYLIHLCIGTSLPGLQIQAEHSIKRAKIKADTVTTNLKIKVALEEAKARNKAALSALRSPDTIKAWRDEEVKRKCASAHGTPNRGSTNTGTQDDRSDFSEARDNQGPRMAGDANGEAFAW